MVGRCSSRQGPEVATFRTQMKLLRKGSWTAISPPKADARRGKRHPQRTRQHRAHPQSRHTRPALTKRRKSPGGDVQDGGRKDGGSSGGERIFSRRTSTNVQTHIRSQHPASLRHDIGMGAERPLPVWVRLQRLSSVCCLELRIRHASLHPQQLVVIPHEPSLRLV